MNDIAMTQNESAEKLQSAQQQLAHWEGALRKLDARLGELDASGDADAEARAQAAVRVLADESDHAAREHLTEIERRSNERKILRESLPQARPHILREIEIAKRRLELSEVFAKAGAKVAQFDEIAATAEKFDALAPRVAKIHGELHATADQLRAFGISVPSNANPYVAPTRSAADLARETFAHFERSHVKAKAALEAFEANPLPLDELHERQRQTWAQEAEAERQQRIAEEQRKADEKAEAWQRECEERRRAQENAVVYRAGEGHPGRVIDLTPGAHHNQSGRG